MYIFAPLLVVPELCPACVGAVQVPGLLAVLQLLLPCVRSAAPLSQSGLETAAGMGILPGQALLAHKHRHAALDAALFAALSQASVKASMVTPPWLEPGGSMSIGLYALHWHTPPILAD